MRHGVFLILKPVDASTHLRVSSSTTCSTDPGVEVSSRGGEGGAGGHKLELGARVTFIVSPPGVALGSQAQKGGVESHFGADSSWRFEW